MNNKIAIELSPPGGFKGFGALGLEGPVNATGADYLFQRLISTSIGIISIVAIIWFLFILLSGGVSYMNAGGDKAAVEAARKKISNGVIGLVITLFGIFFVNIVGYLLGFDNILNIVGMISDITR